MKTKSLFLSLALMVSVVLSSVAEDGPKLSGFVVVPVKGSEVVKVIYRGENAGRIKLNIYNAESQIIFSQTLTTDGFIRPLNFSGLSYGEYTIEVVDGNTRHAERFNYQPVRTKGNMHVSKLKEEGKFLVAVANTEKVSVKIYDSANNLLHAEEKLTNGGFAQIYNVKSTSEVRFEITDSSGTVKTIRF